MASLEATFERVATQEMVVTRPGAMTGTPPKRGPSTTVYTTSKCTAFYPVSPEVAVRSPLDPPHSLRQCFTLDTWLEGDRITYVTAEAAHPYPYTVVSVADWPWPRGNYVVRDVIVREEKK